MKYINFLFISLSLIFGNIESAQLDLPPTISSNQEGAQDLEKLEKELQETSKAIDEYVATLSPEEQTEFNKAVEEVTEMIEGMSEEEFSEFLGEAFGEELPLEEEVEKEVTEVEREIPTPEPTITKEEKNEQAQAISLIDTIITHTNSFIVKIASSPDLPNKIESWGQKGIIKEWPATLKWTDFKLQLETLSQRLYRLKDIDTQTKKYKYVDDLIKDKVLYNNLLQLKKEAIVYEPNIEIPEFGLEKLSTESKHATQKLTSAYTEVLYTLKVLQALEKLFEKYEPIAKKLRTGEEDTEKKAAQEAKKTVTTERSVVAGREPTEKRAFGGARIPVATTPTPAYTPTSIYAPTKPLLQKEKSVDQIGQKKQATPTSPERKTKSDKSLAATEGGKAEKIRFPERKDPESERILGKVEANMKEIDAMVEKNEKLKNIDTHITSTEPVDRVLAIIEIPSLKRKISETISDIKALNFKAQLLAPTLKKYYKDELQNIFGQYNESLKMVSGEIQTIEEKMGTDEKFKKKIVDEKKYTYLGDEQAATKMQKSAVVDVPTIKDEIPHPTSLYELKDAIENLIKAVEDFSIEKGPKARSSSRQKNIKPLR